MLQQLLLIALIAKLSAGDGDQYFYHLFPNHGDYDPLILDPYHIYGAPYGGFSRAAQSRLASLPLNLPEVVEDEGEFVTSTAVPLYFKVRDDAGRLFACRLYHEDELMPESLYDSMFNAPLLRDESIKHVISNDDMEDKSQRKLISDVPETSPAIIRDVFDRLESSPTSFEDAVTSQYAIFPTKEVASNEDFAESILTNVKAILETAESTQDVLIRLQDLNSVCGQLHKGWWSYEWCFEESITQFHIDYDVEKNSIQVEQILDLGYYKSRSVFLDLESLPPNQYAENTRELARVVDFHDNGNICDETGKSRKTYVNIICCSEKVVQSLKGMLHKGGHPISTNVAAFLDVEEDPDVLCSYNVTICTPLLCEPLDPAISRSPSGDKILSTKDESVLPKENESIREILDRMLTMLCLQSNTGGWWTYEICYKKSIRQFHESIGTKRNSAGVKVASKVVESEHILGRYDASKEKSSIPNHEEWTLVVNVTSSGIGGGKLWGEGNGAYYEIEYIGGDICDHSDVTDAAIVAGSTSGGDGGLERTSSVRFFCGESYDVSVYEDSTCHYIVQVKVPALCKHRLFRAPLVKKQVMKCLPADE